ncbi:MAG: peptidoglycan bridge formation glycyltransferase FemA/FemB family protein [Treponemataceae bacterium]
MSSSFRGLSPAELKRCDSARTFLQSGFWGSFKARFGWNARAFLIDWGKREKSPLLVIRRKLGPGVSFAYVPWGPELPDDFSPDAGARTEALVTIANAVRRELPPDTAFIRFDPPWTSNGASVSAPPILPPFVRAGADVQPPDTVVLDLSVDAETLLSAMKAKWRYNIRLAERKGVMVRRADASALNIFYDLYKETAARDKISIHGRSYYDSLFTHGCDSELSCPDLRLYIAEHEGDALAAIIVLQRGAMATYLYGASSDLKRSLMPAYALQWRAILDAKGAGCTTYDFFGIPPSDDPDHPMIGLYRFKTGFGGTILHRSGSWDYEYKPFVAGFFRFAETARKTVRSARKALRRTNRKDSRPSD